MADVIITTDRTMMSNHHGKEFLGFGATGVPVLFPEKFWLYLFAPKMKNKKGIPWQASYGIRKIEAKLLDSGIDTLVVDPDYLDRYIDNAKVLLLSHHDYFGFGPPSSTFASIFKEEPLNARSFARLMESDTVRRAKNRGIKIIAGGPSAWQWNYRKDLMDKWGIDTVVDGEGEKIVVDLVKKAINNEELPRFVVMNNKDAPTIEEISEIKHASVNGLIEIMRGCIRGCKFCSVTLRALRFYPYEKIEKELQVNYREGVRSGILHAEDVPLYGSLDYIPKTEKLIKLHELTKKYYKTIAWSHASLAAILAGEKNDKMLTRVSEIIKKDQDWWGAEIGIETGSPRLAEIIMPNKAKPFETKNWPDVVVEAAGVMQDAGLVPAMTLIVGLPEETEEDVIKTIELVERLWDFKAIIMPMFFVPMGILKNKDWYRAYELTDTQQELLKLCLSHGVRQGKRILRNYFNEHLYYYLIYPFYWSFIETIERVAKRKGYLISDLSELKINKNKAHPFS
ncbi:MAG: radical SAM protein [Thermoplasmata archaeon]|nr:radical SAM protein [Euryarchaeota archaeon]MVT35468.1 radical SAM protein [Euryarchaeota archaeon]